MDINAYKAHLKVMKKLEEKYNDKERYPRGINSENADLIDTAEYYDAKHYTSLYHLFQAIKNKDEEAVRKFRKEATDTLKELKKCDKKMGIESQGHGLEHIPEISELD
mgnify:CR=1 FL=1